MDFPTGESTQKGSENYMEKNQGLAVYTLLAIPTKTPTMNEAILDPPDHPRHGSIPSSDPTQRHVERRVTWLSPVHIPNPQNHDI